jgi:WD40 repeat protein
MRGWRLVLVALAGLLAAVAATVLAVALNAATGGTAQWFPTMDRHPLWWTAGATAAVAGAGLVVWRVQGWYDRGRAELLPAVQQPEPWVVDRPDEVNQIVAALRNPQGGTVGITTAVQGAGGFGKTTVAKVIRADSRVLRQFSSRVYWVTVGRDVSGDALARLVNGLITRMDPDRALTATDTSQAAEQLAAVLAKGPPRLVILDDVWTDEQLAAFPQAGRSARLVTTRNPSLVGGTIVVVRVDQMSPAQAQAVLLAGLPPLPAHLSQALLVQTGRWPLLLRLVNKILADQARLQPDISTAAGDLLARLQGGGTLQVDELTGAAAQQFDVKDSGQRGKAVRATVQASTGLLSVAEHGRLAELGVFAANETIPVALAAALWKICGGLDRLAAGGLCARLADLALLNLVPGNDGGAIEVHDVIRDYLREELGPERLPGINQGLLDAAAADLPVSAAVGASGGGGSVTAWWELPQQAGYLLDHLIEHLLAAGRSQDAEAVACDLRWAGSRLAEAGPAALSADLVLVGTPRAERLRRLLGQSAHLLASTELPHSQLDILFSRVSHDPDWGYQASILRAERTQPALVSLWSLPDLPDPALRQVLDGHAVRVNAVAIAPDGTWLASGGADRSVRIWDPVTGQGTVLAGHADVVTAVAIAPDSTWLASAGFDGSVRIWDVATGEQRAALTVPTVPGAGAAHMTEVAIAPDGTWLASTEIGGTVRIWDPATGSQRAALASPTGVTGPVAIAPDSTWLATVGRSGTVRIWDAATGGQRAVLTGHDRDAAVEAVAIAPDGTWLATASKDRTARIWDAATWRERAVLAGHPSAMTTLAIAPDGTWLATASWDETVRIWDPATGRQRAVLAGQTGRVEEISIAPDGTWLATSGDIGEPVRIWDPVTGNQRADLAIPVKRGGTDKHMAIAPDGTWLASTESDGTVRIWDLAAGKESIATTQPVRNVSAVAFAPDGTWLAGVVGDIDKPLRVWDTTTGQQSALPIPLHLSYMSGVAIAPDGTWLALTWNGWLGTWSQVTGQYYWGAGHATAGAVAIAPDGTWLAAASSDKTVRIWDTAATGQHRVAAPGATLTGATLTGATLTGHDDSVLAVAIAPDGTWLATASSDHTARIWDAATWSERAVLAGHDDSVLAVAIALDGTWLATGSSDRSVRIWDTATGRQRALLTGHTRPVRSVAISPDGTWLATVSSDRSVRIWDVAAAAECAIVRVDGEFKDCAWSPSGQSLAVAGQTGMYLFAFNP